MRGKVEWPCRILKLVLGFTRALLRTEEEPRVAVRRLCLGQHLPAPLEAGEGQFTDGHTRGVVCPPGPYRASGGQKRMVESRET